MMFYEPGLPAWRVSDVQTGDLLGWVYARDHATAVGRSLSMWYDAGEPAESVRVVEA